MITQPPGIPASEDRQALLVARGVSKRFGGVRALDGVGFDVRRGEVHALVGENGAGKSTLMHIVAGVLAADSGTLEWEGRATAGFGDARSALRAGVAIVFQERSLFGPLTIAENIFAGRQPAGRLGLIDHRLQRARTRELLDQVGLDDDPETPLERLAPARQQLVEVAKALSVDARLIIFDEPTAALSVGETRRLFDVIGRLRAAGLGVVYISHRLEEVFRIADRVTVLKDGRDQGTSAIGDVTADDLVERMVGRGVNPHLQRSDRADAGAPVVLEVRGMMDPPGRRPRLEDVSLEVHAGEIVALAGLVGAGRSDLALAIFGSRSVVSGTVSVMGQRLDVRTPAEAIAAGIGYLPEDRKDDGLFLDMSVADNVLAVDAPRRGGWRHDAAAGRAEEHCSQSSGTRKSGWRYDSAAGRAETERLCQALRVVCRGADEPVERLSGGNQQKVALAKWLRLKPRVLIVDEPTRGVDVGSKAEIHELLFELARGGTAILAISSDLPEVLAIADRVLVMRAGRLVGSLCREDATEDAIMRLAAVGARGGAR